MAIDQQQLMMQQVQTQQVQGDLAAVKAIDAAVEAMGIKKQIDAIGDNITEGLGNLIGAGVNKVAEKSASGITRSMDSVDRAGIENLKPVDGKRPDPAPSISQQRALSQEQNVGMDLGSSTKDTALSPQMRESLKASMTHVPDSPSGNTTPSGYTGSQWQVIAQQQQEQEQQTSQPQKGGGRSI